MLRRFAIPLFGCTLIAILQALEYGFYLHVQGRPLSLAHVIGRECPVWILWAFCVPAVTAWGERFRLDWPPAARVVAAHVAGLVATDAVFAIMHVVVDGSLGMIPAGTSKWAYFRNSMVYASPTAVITYGATLGLSYAASYAARSRQLLELRTELSKAQLVALRMQLNPHFFFNTLHTIGALVRDGNHKGAVDMIEKLGDVLRRVLRADAEPETPLREEVEFLRKYLEIEQVRFGDRLHVSWQLDPGSESAPVPQLILQPLVENALRHGLSRRARPGSLTISARVQDSELSLEVADDGVGLPGDFAERKGVGLANVRARLTQMYGESAHLDIAPGKAGGVTARIVLPLRAHA